MPLNLSCADFAFPLLPRGHALDLIALLGFKAIDIGLMERSLQFNVSKELSNAAKASAELERQISARGLALADLFIVPGHDFFALAPNHPEKKVRAQSRFLFERSVEYTLGCGGKRMTGVPGVHWKTESYSSSLQRCSDELAWRIDKAATVGITFSVEPHIGSIVSTPPRVAKLLRMTPNLTLTLDYGHFVVQGIPISAVNPLLPHASHFHARAARKGRLQASQKDNTIPFVKIMRLLHAQNYGGFVGVEYVWADGNHCNEVDNLSETILLRDQLNEIQL